jgi:hypothetical protein
MAYPYLPVNPCCTDVVLNTPCGCSSTITNTGCNNNPCSTNLTASSTIVYDGPVLTCTTAEPCDTLNVILQKIDQIICNLLIQINALTIQVNNITTQVITINGDIININNQLAVCCTTTTSSSSTTTSTTTIHPCENFSLNNTGVEPVGIIITDCTTQEQEVIVLLPGDTNICVITNSPLTVPGTVIVTPNGPCTPPTSSTTSTSSTSSTSSTTTTTTTAIPCECLTFYNGDKLDQEIVYIDCNGVTQNDTVLTGATNQYCGCCGVANSPYVTITIGADCINGECPLPLCTIWEWESFGENLANIEYTNCDNVLTIIDQKDVTDNSGTICVYPNTTPIFTPFPPGAGSHVLTTYGISCTEPTTTTTSTSTSTSTTSTTTTITPAYCYTVEIIGNSCLTCWINVEGNEECRDLPDQDTTFYVCAQKDTVVSTCTGTGSSIITGGVNICTEYSQCVPTSTTTSSSTSTSTSTSTTTVAPTTTTTTTAMMVLELFGCCDSTTQYVAYNPILVATLPSVFTATDGYPYEVVTGTPIPGVPTRVISNFTDYDDCATWLVIFGSCPA